MFKEKLEKYLAACESDRGAEDLRQEKQSLHDL